MPQYEFTCLACKKKFSVILSLGSFLRHHFEEGLGERTWELRSA